MFPLKLDTYTLLDFQGFILPFWKQFYIQCTICCYLEVDGLVQEFPKPSSLNSLPNHWSSHSSFNQVPGGGLKQADS